VIIIYTGKWEGMDIKKKFKSVAPKQDEVDDVIERILVIPPLDMS